jgi:hypothetical protein
MADAVFKTFQHYYSTGVIKPWYRIGRLQLPIITIKLTNDTVITLTANEYKRYNRIYEWTLKYLRGNILDVKINDYYTPSEGDIGNNSAAYTDTNITYIFSDGRVIDGENIKYFIKMLEQKTIIEVNLKNEYGEDITLYRSQNNSSSFGRRKNRCTVDDDIRYLKKCG